MAAKASSRMKNKCLMVNGVMQTIDGLHNYRLSTLKNLKGVPFERENYAGDGRDDFNGYLELDETGCRYICPGERGNNFYTSDPVLVKLLKRRHDEYKKDI